MTSTETLHWRNRLSDHPVVLARTDAAAADRLSSLRLTPATAAMLAESVPDLPPGAVSQDWLGLTAALCHVLTAQLFDVPPAFGALPGERAFWFATRDPHHARALAHAASSFVAALLEQVGLDAAAVSRAFDMLEERTETAALDQTMRAFLAEADRRGIPWHRLEARSRVVRLGQGRHQSRQLESMNAIESALAQSTARDKARTFSILGEIGLPVGRFALATTAEEAANLAPSVGFPLVVKPNSGLKGRGVTVGLTSADQVRQAAAQFVAAGHPALLQSMLAGDDHRLLVVDGRLVAAARREPAAVVGDGAAAVEALIRAANANPLRGKGFSRLMNLIDIDDEVVRVLAGQGLTLGSIPAAGRRVQLRRTANISTGGTATDFTQSIHPDNRRLAERAALAIGLRVAGVDFLSPDVTRSWREVGGGICEVNSIVGLRPHWLANPEQDVVSPILDLAYPKGETGRIPTALITGSNGKSTTTRMLARILRAAGHRVGCVTTDGAQVDDEWLIEGDVAGPSGAAIVLREPTVTAAVLETARGGILKHGIYVDRCDVAALLKIQREQVGIDGIDTLEDMARLKRKVIETARDGFVLNAEDALCAAIARELPVGKTILFSLDPETAFGHEHVRAGGRLVVASAAADGEVVEVVAAGSTVPVIAVRDIPATRDGSIRYNVENALAATALAHAMGIAPEVIAAGLRSFEANLDCSPGRFNLLEDFPVRILLDYAHNPPALREAMAALATVPVSGRRVLALGSPGNRPDEQIRDIGRFAAGHAGIYICTERVDRRRGRPEGEIARLVAEGLSEAGAAPDSIRTALSQDEALRLGVALASRPGDLLVILYTEFRTTIAQLNEIFRSVPVAAPLVAAGG